MLLAGPSNAGLAAPAQAASIALQLATVSLLLYRPTTNSEVSLLAISHLVDDVADAFNNCEAEYQRCKAEGWSTDEEA